MNCTLNWPSLKRIALVKVATTLWNQDNIRALVSKFNFQLIGYKREEKWQKIENKVIEKVQQLSLPKSLKEEILGFIIPVGLQILKWKKYHQQKIGLCIGLPSELCWTPQGTVDLKKTAKALIKDESLDVISRYKLAYTYCLEDDVLELWNKIPENCRKDFYRDEDPIKIRQQDLVILWMYNIKKEVNKLYHSFKKCWWQQQRCKCSPYQYSFQYASAVSNNKAAAEYFLQKLTSREREELLVRTAEKLVHKPPGPFNFKTTTYYKADILCFLLSQMDGEQQIQVFKRCPSEVLYCFLRWPWQSLFMEMANRMWDFLSKSDYDYLLRRIVNKVKEGYKDYDYQDLFREFWLQSPNDHKTFVIDEFDEFLLPSLLEIKDVENVKLILKDAILIKKRKLIFSVRGQYICQKLIFSDEWDLLQFFIRECTSLKGEIIHFKEDFEERLKECCSKEEFAKKKDKLFQLLDDFINEYNKRKSVAKGFSSPSRDLLVQNWNSFRISPLSETLAPASVFETRPPCLPTISGPVGDEILPTWRPFKKRTYSKAVPQNLRK